MRVLVLNPSSKITKNVVRDVIYGCWCKGKRIGGGTVPPFALLEVATVLKKSKNDVRFIDAQGERISHERLASESTSYDVVIISTSTMSFNEDVQLLSLLKQNYKNLTTIAFGAHPTFLPRNSLSRKSVDIIVRHEPEFVIRDVIYQMKHKKGQWKSVKGIGYKENGKIIINEPYPLIENLDELPFPDVTLLPTNVEYFNPLVLQTPYITTATSKGCPGRCTFCTAPYFDGMKTRFQSANYVVEEIKYFIKHGYKEVYFRDDTFFVNKNRDVEICQTIINEKLDISWLANARINLIDKETIELAKAAGCHTIKFGVESGSQKILDNVRKGQTIEQVRKIFKATKEVGMKTHAHMMLGMPGETIETLEDTIKLAIELEPDTVTFGICTPYPGSPLFNEVKMINPEIGDGTASDFSKLHTKGLFNESFTNISKKKLECSVRRAYRKFYLRPKYIFRFLLRLRTLSEIKKLSIAALNVLDFIIKGE